MVQKRRCKGWDRVVAVAVERKSVGLDSWAFCLGLGQPAEISHSLRVLVWPFKWVHCLPIGLGGALGSVKVLKLLSIAQQ